MIDRRRFLAGSSLLMAGATLGASRSWAQDAVDRRMLFGYPPGSMGTDLGKAMLQVLAGVGGPSYRLDNVEGRNTRLAAESVKAAAPDGVTLLQSQSTTLCLLPNVYTHTNYDAVKDFSPLATLGDFAMSLTVGPVVPKNVTNVKQYLDWLSDNPDLRNVGFSIYGSEGHLATLILARSEGVTVRPQPYRGAAMMLKDMMGSTLSACFTAAGNGSTEAWSSGKLRSLGVTSRERLKYWPNVPTLAEQGLSGMDLNPWFGWFAPAATPASIIDPLREKIRAMQQAPGYADVQRRLLLTQSASDPEQIRERIRKDSARYAQMVVTYGLEKATDSDMPVVGESHGR